MTPSRTPAVMGGVVSLALIAGVTLLLAMGKNTTDLLSLIGVGVVPILTLVLSGKLSGIAAGTETIQRQTNGTMSALVGLVAELQRELARRTGPRDDGEVPYPRSGAEPGAEPDTEPSPGVPPTIPGGGGVP